MNALQQSTNCLRPHNTTSTSLPPRPASHPQTCSPTHTKTVLAIHRQNPEIRACRLEVIAKPPSSIESSIPRGSITSRRDRPFLHNPPFIDSCSFFDFLSQLSSFNWSGALTVCCICFHHSKHKLPHFHRGLSETERMSACHLFNKRLTPYYH